jgi:hypothetical protein
LPFVGRLDHSFGHFGHQRRGNIGVVHLLDLQDRLQPIYCFRYHSRI